MLASWANVQTFGRIVRCLGLTALTPTWALAVVLKWAFGDKRKALTITVLNGIYLAVAVLSSAYVWQTELLPVPWTPS
jgi:hypothetical protein